LTNEEFQRLVLDKLTTLDSDVKGLKDGQNRFESEFKSVKEIVLKIEHDHGAKLDALFDVREIQKEINERIFTTFDRLEAKIDVLQMETAHIRRIK